MNDIIIKIHDKRAFIAIITRAVVIYRLDCVFVCHFLLFIFIYSSPLFFYSKSVIISIIIIISSPHVQIIIIPFFVMLYAITSRTPFYAANQLFEGR